ncbi:MAG: hypothetical protein M3R39_11090 [Actinomycetota bacterium]|nr:hypothetical protein [Actinomycetota bacterium]
MNARLLVLIAVVPAALAAAGCGGGKSASSAPSPTTTSHATTQQTTTQHTTTTGSGSPGALQAEAATAATGDIPDNQVFLVYRSPAGWTIKYPEGWARSGAPAAVTIRDKNNIVRVVVAPGKLPTAAQARSDPSLHGARIRSGPQETTIESSRALKVVYTSESPPNPVTGKRVTLIVDRYYLAHAGRLATIDLGTPVGVDNVDAYRLMSESFRWK